MNKFLILLIQYEMIFQIYSQSIPQLVNIFGRKKNFSQWKMEIYN